MKRTERLVFTGDLDGTVLAFDDRDGTLLWKDGAGLPIGGGVVACAVGGKQYLVVSAGLHAPVTWQLESAPCGTSDLFSSLALHPEP